MIKKLFIYMSLLLAMTACSVDEFDAPSGLSDEGDLTVTLAVPEMETVETRADEWAVSKVVMLAVSGEKVAQIETIDITSENNLGGNQYRIKKNLKQELRSKSDLKLYFIANPNEGVNFDQLMGRPEATLKALYAGAYANNSQQLTMSGMLPIASVRAGNAVPLRRNVAKVTVREGKQNADGSITTGSTIYPVAVYGVANSSSIVAGAIGDLDNMNAASQPTSIAAPTQTEVYVHRTVNNGRNADNRPYMIVKAKYDNKDYFYRLEFERFNSATNKFETLNILSNHHYQVLIEKVLGPGDADAAAASKNPTSLLKATIYDYCPESYNMITDGSRELGVSGKLLHTGNPTTGGTPEYLYIKVYSPDSSEYTNPSTNVKLSSNVTWLTFGTIAAYSSAAGEAIPGTENYKGTVYRVPVHFNKNIYPGDLEGTITVTWKGLTREVPVSWNREFDASEICTVQLVIKDNKGTEKFSTGYVKGNDYWSFIRDKNQIDGLSEEQNNGKIRNEGLHFPVNYGGPSARWKYEYKVKFNNLNDGNAYDWRVSTTTVRGISISPQTSGTNVTGTVELTITFDPTNVNWDYEVGELVFEISQTGRNNYKPYTLDLYHTGFFDNPAKFRNTQSTEGVRFRVDKTEADKFYYYEVVSGPSSKYYWLDRNLGATSSEYYIEAAGDMTYYGNPEAAGGYYRAAKYVNGKEPEMYADLCPPGFEIPRVDAWNALRNSPNFITRQNGTYYQAEFTNPAGQTVYFPRVMFYDSHGIKTGESRAGYYWSQTPANGLEKDQIGNWLRYLKFSGSIASYDNAEVAGRNGSNGHAMSVRCVNATESTSVTMRTFFNVSGATHVFLYSIDSEGNRNAVTNWPGQAIGNYVTMGNAAGTGSGTQWFSFSYESPTTAPQDFYVMFTFRDKDGIWHTMSKGDNGQTVYSTSARPSTLNGWKVVGDTWDGLTTALNGKWVCNYQPSTNTATVKYQNPDVIPPVIEPLPDNLTVYYSNPNGWNKVWVYAWNGDTNTEVAGWPGIEMQKINGVWTGTIPRWATHVIFNSEGTGGSKGQTGDLGVVMENNHTY